MIALAFGFGLPMRNAISWVSPKRGLVGLVAIEIVTVLVIVCP